MCKYVICPVSRPPPLCGDADAGSWNSAESLSIDHYPWYTAGEKQPTAVRALYDERAFYLQFLCRDRHIHALTTELNGPVYQDSCVEFFAAIDPARAPDYFNFEINCCGTFHLGFGASKEGRRVISPKLASKVRTAASVDGKTRNESETDTEWWVAAAIPFEMLGEFVGREVRPKMGDIWCGNFYRCGGKTDPQFACWSPIETPGCDFHRPEFFGELHFA